MRIVLVHRDIKPVNRWCVLRAAWPGARITLLCGDARDYAKVNVMVVDLADHDARLPSNLCPACRTELAAQTPGAAVALEPAPAIGRTVTRDIRRRAQSPDEAALEDMAGEWNVDVEVEHEDLLEAPVEGRR